MYVRKNFYLANPKCCEEHRSIDGKLEISSEILNLEALALTNIFTYIQVVPIEKIQNYYPKGITSSDKFFLMLYKNSNLLQ